MTSFLTIFLIGVSLSMDAFSLSIIYGIIGLSKKHKILLAIIVGTYHFIMPLLGLALETIVSNFIFINLNIIASIILLYIGFDLIISNSKEEEAKSLNNFGLFLFGLPVSIDSLMVGLGLKAITNSYFFTAFIFSICSAILTYLGLMLGNIIGNKVGTYSKMAGGLILIIIAIIMFIK